jgi:carbamoyltransferase
MLTLGLSGGFDLVDQNREYFFPPGAFHDGAAALVHDGRVVAAVEEERFNRIKHSSKGAVSAIRFCLERHGARLSDVDALAVYVEEQFFNQTVRGVYANVIHAAPVMPPRSLVHELLERGLGTDIDDRKLVFVRHHLAHALGAYVQSGFDDSLVLTIDGAGDWESGTVAHAASGSLQIVQTFSNAESLGSFYSSVCSFLGFGGFEEYKVMGLAPYGDPRRYRRLFQSLYDLYPYGNYAIRWDRFDALSDIGAPRKKNEPVTEFHQNVAAALQEALEQIVGHVLAYYRWLSGHRRLCMAGGVAHNCSLNGKILYSGLFDEIFVHPASHDAGCAIGAAFYPFATELGSWRVPVHGTAVSFNGQLRSSRLEHVYWGPDIGTPEAIQAELDPWADLLEYERADDIVGRTARLLADGRVVGWAQGSSEFGPRALGNRSILADPRPAGNRELINRMVKKREAFRPFAPAVLEEFVDEYFELPRKQLRLPFMIFVVRVRPEKRSLLGATTHVDGSARVQTVSRSTNPRFWELIEAFGRLTGVPVLLNTSFNNNAEPIVESAADAITCFLTTSLDYLVLGDFLVHKKDTRGCFTRLVPSLPRYAKLVTTRRFAGQSPAVTAHEIGNTYNEQLNVSISADASALLADADGARTLENLATALGWNGRVPAPVLDEILELWSRRVVRLRPAWRERGAILVDGIDGRDVEERP